MSGAAERIHFSRAIRACQRESTRALQEGDEKLSNQYVATERWLRTVVARDLGKRRDSRMPVGEGA